MVQMKNQRGSVNVINDIPDNIEGFDVLIVDDIVDTGITMNFVITTC